MTAAVGTAAGQPTESTPLLRDNRSHIHHNCSEESVATSKDDEEIVIEEVSLRTEASILVRYSGPLVITYFLQYAYQVIIIVVAAQLSTEEIAGVSLGITTANITGFAVFEGMATALDTLCSQAYGSSSLADVGLYTIRATILVHLVAVIPIGTFWLFSGPLIAALVPSQSLALHASSFLRYTLIGVPGFVTFENGKRFMQAQGDFTAGMIILILCLPINIGLTYLLVYVADMRVAGAALSASLTNFVRPILLAAYARFVKPSTLKCWPSTSEISSEWRKEWGLIMRLAIPGTLMTLSEWMCFEILTFATAFVSDEALAGQTFIGTVATLVWHVPFSASVACSTRVGQLVGAGMTSSTRKVMKWYAVVFLIAGLFDALLGTGFIFLTLRYLIHDDKVAQIVKAALPYAAVFMIWDATVNWPHSIGRGFGWQDIGAWCTMTINYLYAVPVAIFLELGPPKMGISGLWIGLGSALFLTTVIEAFAIWKRLAKTTDGRVLRSTSDDESQ
ncbi:hypothetical protein CKM354_001208600 [Cercospora kikuchii]|uniref:Transporter n=1 Tax=Cercospora kikuchii TaxID=84275 RepID=A0A9P3CU88_9PEZI|nr:uncharacterized protein CKM354_001208600 [Cercospora kikuchii]GIZ49046.1 hypothetical protein CKM354_001208600 [Cercospora kikuchii]